MTPFSLAGSFHCIGCVTCCQYYFCMIFLRHRLYAASLPHAWCDPGRPVATCHSDRSALQSGKVETSRGKWSKPGRERTHARDQCLFTQRLGAPVKAQELIRQYQGGERDFVLISLRRCELSGTDLYGINLSGSELRGCDLSQANLIGARLRRADLSWANLSGADLSGADLGSADLRAADLREAKLSHANLEHAKVTQEQLAEAATLEGAIMPDGDTHASL